MPGYSTVFKCENDKAAYLNNSLNPVHCLCDNKTHYFKFNSADELNCPGRFYCSVNNPVAWINESLVCDKKKDCMNGKDEWSDCTMDGSVSFEYMVKSKLITVLATFGGLSIMIINISVGLQTFHVNPISKAAQIDRIFRLSICFYDFQMGAYLFSIIIALIVIMFKGYYCEFDEDWRASVTCMMLGVIFSVSSHGSLIIIGIMSILRCLKCSLGLSFEISTITAWIVIVIVFLLSFVYSIVPILPIYQLQDFFRTSIILKDVDRNPFITSREGPDMIENVRRIHIHYFSNSSSTDTIRILADLRNANITSDNTIFDVADIGYYGNTPLCISNVFKVQGNYNMYKIVYCVVVAVLLTAITASCTGENPPAKMFEIFALIVIPINSLLNPIFYSQLYKNITSYLWTTGKKYFATIKERVQYRIDNEIELQVYYSNAILRTLPHLQKVQPNSLEIAEHPTKSLQMINPPLRRLLSTPKAFFQPV